MLEIAAITFDGQGSAAQKLSEMEDQRDDPWVSEVAVLEHDSAGEYSLKGVDSDVDKAKSGKGAAVGGLTGLAVGLIGGPAGLLLWSTIGAGTGAAIGDSKESSFRPTFQRMKDRLPADASMQVLVGETPSIEAFVGAVGARDAAVMREALTSDQAKELSERDS